MACLVDRQPNTPSIVSRYRDRASAPVRQEGDLVGRHGVGGASLKVNTSTLVLCPGDMGGEACSCAAITLIKWSNGVFSASPPEQVLSSSQSRSPKEEKGARREDGRPALAGKHPPAFVTLYLDQTTFCTPTTLLLSSSRNAVPGGWLNRW